MHCETKVMMSSNNEPLQANDELTELHNKIKTLFKKLSYRQEYLSQPDDQLSKQVQGEDLLLETKKKINLLDPNLDDVELSNKIISALEHLKDNVAATLTTLERTLERTFENLASYQKYSDTLACNYEAAKPLKEPLLIKLADIKTAWFALKKKI